MLEETFSMEGSEVCRADLSFILRALMTAHSPVSSISHL
jgi:hypothetical protein